MDGWFDIQTDVIVVGLNICWDIQLLASDVLANIDGY